MVTLDDEEVYILESLNNGNYDSLNDCKSETLLEHIKSLESRRMVFIGHYGIYYGEKFKPKNIEITFLGFHILWRRRFDNF
ncbi:MAG: hypothetical protein ABSG15_15355 [FCB group bacterium]|jgi:hypothetical protein